MSLPRKNLEERVRAVRISDMSAKSTGSSVRTVDNISNSCISVLQSVKVKTGCHGMWMLI